MSGLREVFTISCPMLQDRLIRSAEYAESERVRLDSGGWDPTVTRHEILTPAQAAVIAAAKNWAANQRGWLKPVDETLAQAVDTLRAQEGE